MFFPAELFSIAPGQPSKGTLDPSESQEMINFACRAPYLNAQSLTTLGRQVLSLDGNELLRKFGVSVGKDLVTVHGRVLTSPTVMYRMPVGKSKTTKDRERTTGVATGDGSWNMKAVSFMKPGRLLNRWTWIYIVHNNRNGDTTVVDEAGKAIKAFATYMIGTLGVNMVTNPIHSGGLVINTVSRHEYSAIRSTFQQLASTSVLPQLAIVVLPDDADVSVYDSVKLLADTEFGFHTVGVVRRKLVTRRYDNYDMQYFANVALKVNLKMGGVNHRLIEEVDLIREGRTMFVGYDVVHPTNVVGDAKDMFSYVGLVASVNKDMGQWPAASWSQKSRQEMLKDEQNTLQKVFCERLALWRRHNGEELPENIIIFRDGVSESQYAQVVADELPQIRGACLEQCGNDPPPRIALVVSVKRHHTRFFPTSQNAAERTRSNNIKNGTVVDRGVTLARYWDFFLTAHNALQGMDMGSPSPFPSLLCCTATGPSPPTPLTDFSAGTARPAHYTVIHDEVFVPRYGERSAHVLEKLTHDMCYLFGRATKAVSICPPAYYADIVCTRARLHVGRIGKNLQDDGQSMVSAASDGAWFNIPPPAIKNSIKNDMYYI